MTLRKIFDLIIAGLGVLLFIFMFIPYFLTDSYNMWKFSTAMSVFMLFNIIGIIAVYMLHFFDVVKDKWMQYANFAVGAVTYWHVSMLFHFIDATKVGIWLGTIATLGMFVLAILWNIIVAAEVGTKQGKKITGYDPKTGKPIYAEPKGYDPKTGKPIYE